MRVLVTVNLDLRCAGAQLDVEMDLEMEATVMGYTPAEPAGLEHAPVSEEWDVELRLCDSLKVEDIVVLEAGQIFDPDDQQMEDVIKQLREDADTP